MCTYVVVYMLAWAHCITHAVRNHAQRLVIEEIETCSSKSCTKVCDREDRITFSCSRVREMLLPYSQIKCICSLYYKCLCMCSMVVSLPWANFTVCMYCTEACDRLYAGVCELTTFSCRYISMSEECPRRPPNLDIWLPDKSITCRDHEGG